MALAFRRDTLGSLCAAGSRDGFRWITLTTVSQPVPAAPATPPCVTVGATSSASSRGSRACSAQPAAARWRWPRIRWWIRATSAHAADAALQHGHESTLP